MRNQINSWYNAIGFTLKSDLFCTPQKQLIVPEYPLLPRTEICVQPVFPRDPPKLQCTGLEIGDHQSLK